MQRFFAQAGERWRNAGLVARWRLVLGLAMAALAIALLATPKPWTVAVGINGKMDVLDYVEIYGWAAGAINLGILGVLMLLCPWWAQPFHGKRSTLNAQLSTPKWFWPLVIVAMAVTGFYAVQRLNFSFWDDEELNIRTTLYGKFKRDGKTQEVEFKRFGWVETVFGYKKGPNSHSLYSILARAGADVADAVSRPAGFPVREWPFRVPALFFGVAAVATLAWMLRSLGLPGAGVLAAFILAFHPWHIRYASEARGYSELVCLVPLLVGFWQRCFTRGTWGWWAALAAVEFALLYCYPGMLIALAVLNALTLLRFGAAREPWFGAQTGRWFCTNAIAGMVTVQLMLPLYPQGQEYFAYVSSQGFTAGTGWMVNTISFMLAGAPWSKSGDLSAGYPELSRFQYEHPAVFLAAAFVAGCLILLGAWRLLRLGWPGFALVAVTFLCPVIIFEVANFKRILLYECYVIYSLPGLVACAAAGAAFLIGRLGELPADRVLAPATAVVLVGGFFAATNSFREWIAHHALQQIRESVVFSRGTLDPGAGTEKKILTASFCIPPYLYDAGMDRLDTAGQFVEELHRADREGKTLYLNIGMPWAARAYNPQMWELFNNRRLFGAPVVFRGFEPSLDRMVARYNPHSADAFDFSAIAVESR